MKIKFRDFLLGGSCLAAGYIAAGMSAAAKEKEFKKEMGPEESGVPEKSIKKCVMCVQKTAGGFVWKVNFLSDEKAEN